MASTSTVLNQERMKAYSDAADKALAVIKSHLDAKQQELQEYNSLIHCLEELPKKRTHHIMSPIGSVGFLPATIVHTNEVLVGLGDGYFVDTTAYDATEILKRRKNVIEKNIADLHQHQDMVIKQHAFAKQLFNNQSNSDEVEIREDYDEAKENELRKKRRSRVTSPRILSKTVADINAEAELMKRLQELELQETRNAELDDPVYEKEAGLPSSPVEILQKLDVEESKYLMSILASSGAGDSSSDASQNPETYIPVKSIQAPTDGEPHKGSSSPTPIEESISTSSGCFAENVSEGILEGELTPGVFRGEDLVRMLTEQSDVYEENIQAYQPPRGVSTEDYQKLLRMVDSMDSEESGSDRISEENESYESSDDVHYMNDSLDEGSELDSDDISTTDAQESYCDSHSFSKHVQLGECVVNSVDRNGPLINHDIQAKCAPRTTVGTDHATETGIERENQLQKNADAGHKLNEKVKAKRRKNVTFSENLEYAAVIDSQAPPCNVRGSTISASKTPVKKILSNYDEKSPVDDHAVKQMNDQGERHNFGFRDTSTVFTGVFHERNTDLFTTSSAPAINTEPPKQPSLFKMRRLRNNS